MKILLFPFSVVFKALDTVLAVIMNEADLAKMIMPDYRLLFTSYNDF